MKKKRDERTRDGRNGNGKEREQSIKGTCLIKITSRANFQPLLLVRLHRTNQRSIYVIYCGVRRDVYLANHPSGRYCFIFMCNHRRHHSIICFCACSFLPSYIAMYRAISICSLATLVSFVYWNLRHRQRQRKRVVKRSAYEIRPDFCRSAI